MSTLLWGACSYYSPKYSPLILELMFALILQYFLLIIGTVLLIQKNSPSSVTGTSISLLHWAFIFAPCCHNSQLSFVLIYGNQWSHTYVLPILHIPWGCAKKIFILPTDVDSGISTSYACNTIVLISCGVRQKNSLLLHDTPCRMGGVQFQSHLHIQVIYVLQISCGMSGVQF